MASQGLQDLMLALQSFNSGLKSLQTSRVLNNANEAVEQIRASDIDAQQKKTQIRGIADQLTMKLVGLGGSADEAAKIAAQLSPAQEASKAQNPFQLFHQSMAMGDTDGAKLALQWEGLKDERAARAEEARDKRLLAGIEATNKRTEVKQGRQDTDLIKDSYNKFRNQEAKTFEALAKLPAAEDLASGDAGKQQAAKGLLQRMVVGLGGDPRVSDQDAEALSSNPSLLSKVQRQMSLLAKGEPLDDDFKDYGVLVRVVSNASKDYLRDRALSYSASMAPTLRGVQDPKDYAKSLLTYSGLREHDKKGTAKRLAEFNFNPEAGYDESSAPSLPVTGGNSNAAPQVAPSGSKFSRYTN